MGRSSSQLTTDATHGCLAAAISHVGPSPPAVCSSSSAAIAGLVFGPSPTRAQPRDRGATTKPDPTGHGKTAGSRSGPRHFGALESETAYQHLRRTGSAFRPHHDELGQRRSRAESTAAGGLPRPQRPRATRCTTGTRSTAGARRRPRGFEPFIYVQTAPRWANRTRAGGGIGSVPSRARRALADFMAAAARRYGGGFGGCLARALLAGLERAEPQHLPHAADRRRPGRSRRACTATW